MADCPIECVRAACPDPDFIEKNGAWLLTVVAGFTGCVGMVLTYFLKSRCTKIGFCGVNCARDPIDLTAKEVAITSSKA